MAVGIVLKPGFIEKLDKIIGNSENLTRQASEEMHFYVEEHFKAEGNPPWHPLAPSTLKQRMKKGYTGKILQRTNLLQSSVVPFHDKTLAGVGTNLKYGGIHERGGVINIPAHERVIRFKTDGKGNLSKRSGRGADSDDKYLLTFAKKRSKNQVQRKVSVKGYSITIPKRSYLELTSGEKEELGKFIISFINES